MSNANSIEAQKQQIRQEFNERITRDVNRALMDCLLKAEKRRGTAELADKKPLNAHIGEFMLEKAERLQKVQDNIYTPADDPKKLLEIATADAIREKGQEMITQAYSKLTP